jgi:hypothetical protein
MERSGDFVNDNGTFAYAKVPRSNWNSTLILLKAEGSFKAVVAVWLQQFAPALLERRHGPGALTGNWNFGMKKTLLLVTASLIALSAAAPASAADLAARPYTKAPPPMVAAIFDWTGFYIGINGGGGFSHNCWDLVAGGREGCHDANGGTVGGQIDDLRFLKDWRGQDESDSRTYRCDYSPVCGRSGVCRWQVHRCRQGGDRAAQAFDRHLKDNGRRPSRDSASLSSHRIAL